MKKTIFISYSHKDKGVAEIIEKDLRPADLQFIRDDRDLQYMGSIQEFMGLIKATDFVMLIISEAYLKSQNCMKEVMDFFSTKNHIERTLLVGAGNVDIFQADKRIEYLKFWDQEINSLNDKLKTLNILSNADSIISNLNHLSKIRSEADLFYKFIIDRPIYSFKYLKKQKYKPILERVGIKDLSLINDIIRVQELQGEMQEIAMSQLLRHFPFHQNVLFLKAYIEASKGNKKVARYFYKQVLKDDKKNESANLNLLITLMEAQEYEEAKKQANITLALNPANPVTNFCMAELCKIDLDERAITYYEQAIRYNPGYFEAHFNLGQLLFKWQQDYDRASLCYQNALKIDPGSIPATIALTECYEKLEKYAKAYDIIQKALTLSSSSYELTIKASSLSEKLKKNSLSPGSETKKTKLRDYTTTFYTINNDLGFPCVFYTQINERPWENYSNLIASRSKKSNGEILVRIGDHVKQGDLIGTISENNRGKIHNIFSNRTGYVEDILVNNYDPINPGDAILILSNRDPGAIDSSKYSIIKSQIFGNIYRHSQMDGPIDTSVYGSVSYQYAPFSYGRKHVNLGDKITIGQPLCAFGTMGLYIEVESEFEGEIEKILFNDGDSLEYESPLFLISETASFNSKKIIQDHIKK